MDNPDNMREIFKMAQEVAKNINIPQNKNGQTDPSQLDMSEIFRQVSKSVTQMVTPDFVEKFSGQDQKTPTITNESKKTKISVDSEDDDLEPAERTLPKTKDLHFTLNVSLKNLYNGKKKNIAVKRLRYVKTDDDKTVLQEERKTLVVNITPGMEDEEVVIFEGEGDEKKGYTPGDVIVTLCCEENSTFTRMGNDLFMNHDISLSECFDLDFTFKHINGEILGVKRIGTNIMNGTNYFKIENKGMPMLNTESYGNLYIKINCIMMDSLTPEEVAIIKKVIPPISEKEETDNYHDLVEVTEEELDSFCYNDDDEDEDEDEDDDDDGAY